LFISKLLFIKFHLLYHRIPLFSTENPGPRKEKDKPSVFEKLMTNSYKTYEKSRKSGTFWPILLPVESSTPGRRGWCSLDERGIFLYNNRVKK
jgi:hypothetical protein